MGTDIRWVVEVKRGDAWHVVEIETEIYRNYQAFFALSGIREDIVRARGYKQDPFFEPRYELPSDASDELRSIAEDEYTPHDWRTLAELQAHDWSWTQSNIVDAFAEMAKLGAPEDVRAIWWFD